MHYLIVISVAGKPKAIERLEALIEGAVVEATQSGGIDGLTTEVVQGPAAEVAREALRNAAAGRTRRKAGEA